MRSSAMRTPRLDAAGRVTPPSFIHFIDFQ